MVGSGLKGDTHWQGWDWQGWDWLPSKKQRELRRRVCPPHHLNSLVLTPFHPSSLAKFHFTLLYDAAPTSDHVGPDLSAMSHPNTAPIIPQFCFFTAFSHLIDCSRTVELSWNFSISPHPLFYSIFLCMLFLPIHSTLVPDWSELKWFECFCFLPFSSFWSDWPRLISWTKVFECRSLSGPLL